MIATPIQSVTESLPIGYQLIVAAGANSAAFVEQLLGESRISTTLVAAGATVVIGPFITPMTMRVSCSQGTASTSTAVATGASNVAYNPSTGALSSGGVEIGVGNVAGLVFNDPSLAIANANMAIIQAALDKQGRVEIHGSGTLYYPGFPDPMPASPAYPAALSIGSYTEFYVAPTVNIAIVPGRLIQAFLGNKAFMGNRVSVTSWSYGTAFSNYRPVTFTLATALALDVNDWMIVDGDRRSAAGWRDAYRVEGVNVPGAATQVTINVWSGELTGLSRSALDTVYAYKCDAHSTIDIRGSVSSLGTLGVGPSQFVQPDVAALMFSKTKSFKIPQYRPTDTTAMKSIIMCHAYTPHIGRVESVNSGAGVTLLAPIFNAEIGEIVKHGGEDALLLQTYATSAGPTLPQGLLDADGTESGGDISGVHVGSMKVHHPWFSCFTVEAHNDRADIAMPRTISGLIIDHMDIKFGASDNLGAFILSGSTQNGAGGGEIGTIKIGKMVFEDAQPQGDINLVGQGIFAFDTQNNPGPTRFGGVVVDDFEVRQSPENPVNGLRQLIFNYNAASGSVCDQLIIKSANVELDQQNVVHDVILNQIGSNVTVDTMMMNGKFNTSLSLQNIALSAAGTGYVVGDLVNIVGGSYRGRASIRVLTVGGGGSIATFEVVRRGRYTAVPASPASVTGGTGSGATFTFNTVVYGVVFYQCAAGSWLKNYVMDSGSVNLVNTNEGATQFGNGSSAGITKMRISNVSIGALGSIIGSFYNNLDLYLSNIDLSNVQRPIGYIDGNLSNRTFGIWMTGCSFNPNNVPVYVNSGLTLSGLVFKLRSGGGNSNLGSQTSWAYNYHAGIQVNYLGMCVDLPCRFDTAIVIGRTDGSIVNDLGGGAGTPAAIGPGLVACFGTASGSWKSLNPSKSANSY